MTLIETTFGLTIKWGYNCEENLRDLRKLNDSFSTHHPDYEKFCKRSDLLIGECIYLLAAMDKIVQENDGNAWPEQAVENYNYYEDGYRRASEQLDDLCINEYPRDAHKYHYSYCV